jgi:hypothetical protein
LNTLSFALPYEQQINKNRIRIDEKKQFDSKIWASARSETKEQEKL